jgi:pSer/pThr/pTyr-binding forkhead associated (FHA) protein
LLKVMVNDQAVSSRALRSGDRVRIGNTTFIYEV